MATTQVPLTGSAVITTNSAPVLGRFNRYDATSGSLVVTLPALSGQNVAARMAVQKYTGDVSSNTVTFNCAGSDKFDDGVITQVVLSSTGAQRELQVVSISGTKRWKVVGTYSDSLTATTLINPTLQNYTEAVVVVGTVTTAKTLSLTNGTVQTATLTASTACTFTMPTATAGKSFLLLLKQAATTGNGTATFAGVKWDAGGAPTITATAGKMDILTFTADGTNWYGSALQGFTP